MKNKIKLKNDQSCVYTELKDTTGTFKIKKKNIEAFRCRAAIQSQFNGLVTHSTEVSIRIAFTLSKKDVHPLFLGPLPFLPFWD